MTSRSIYIVFLIALLALESSSRGNPIMGILCKNTDDSAKDSSSDNDQKKMMPDCTVYDPTLCNDPLLVNIDFCAMPFVFTWDATLEICSCSGLAGVPIYDADTNPALGFIAPFPDPDVCDCPINTSPVAIIYPSGDAFWTCGSPICFEDTYEPSADCNGATIDVTICGLPAGGVIQLENLENCDVVENFEILQNDAQAQGVEVAFGPAEDDGCFTFELVVDDPTQDVGIDFIDADDLLITPDCELILGPLPVDPVPTLGNWGIYLLGLSMMALGIGRIKVLEQKQEIVR